MAVETIVGEAVGMGISFVGVKVGVEAGSVNVTPGIAVAVVTLTRVSVISDVKIGSDVGIVHDDHKTAPKRKNPARFSARMENLSLAFINKHHPPFLSHATHRK